jgi:hypothetical protein
MIRESLMTQLGRTEQGSALGGPCLIGPTGLGLQGPRFTRWARCSRLWRGRLPSTGWTPRLPVSSCGATQ